MGWLTSWLTDHMALLWIYVAALVFWGLFLHSYFRNKKRICNGMFLCLALAVTFASIVLTCARYAYLPWVHVILWFFLIPIFCSPVILVAVGIFLIINGRIVLKREGKALTHFLSILLGVGMIVTVCVISYSIYQTAQGAPKFTFLANMLIFVGGYYLFLLLSFLLSVFLYRFNRPNRNQDFIIVLGSGLLGDQVPPLLARRLDAGIAFYEDQRKSARPPKIIVSGGQGANETISEAEAMKRYLIRNHIPAEDILLENQSTTTYENLLYSKRLMGQGTGTASCVFVTNDYHVFRAGVYADQVGIQGEGVCCKTAAYYLPVALIREWIAILKLHWKTHLGITFGMVILLLAQCVIAI